MPRTPANVLAMLKDSTPNPPFVKRPTYAETLDALRLYADHDATAAVARELVERDAASTVWFKRHTALRLALVSHYTTTEGNMAVACHCRQCAKWRPEFETSCAAAKA